MANSAPPQSNDTPDSTPWGIDNGATTAAYGQSVEEGSYDQRDDMAGGTDTKWNQGADRVSGANWASAGDTAPVTDAAKWSKGGVLSQADLAG